MAQQASPKVAPQNDDFRAQLDSFSTLVSKIPAGSFSSIPMTLLPTKNPRKPGSVPVEAATSPHVRVGDEDGDDEQDHLDEAEDAEGRERHRPRVQEDGLDVEDDEEHRGQVEPHREPATADR